MKPKKFINKPENAVTEYIEGLILQYPSTLQKLQNHNVILQKPISKTKVNLLSGGGSGHEPAHAGFIGRGMLTGAICGGMFASPPVSDILAAIRAVTDVGDDSRSSKGCLLIVKNYTGDRLNFGMACEMANAEGRLCKMVVVADDCAVPRSKGSITGARGVAGTIFIHKVAGAMAEDGQTLDDIVQVVTVLARNMGSLGVALDSVTLPGAEEVNDRLSKGNLIEIGLGIHGEAGIRQSPLLSADEIAAEMVSTIQNFGYGDDYSKKLVSRGDPLVVLVNNLGGTSNFELSILFRSIHRILTEDIGCTITRCYVGSFMTSFNMHGVSLSILNLAPTAESNNGSSSIWCNLLDALTTAPAWQESIIEESSSVMTVLPEVQAPVIGQNSKNINLTNTYILAGLDSKHVTSAINAACKAVVEAEKQLTEWDLIVGDGDCGITMARGGKEILSRLNSQSLSVDNPVKLFLELAEAISVSMGGTSGILFELFFRKASTACLSSSSSSSSLLNAFAEGVEAVKFYGGAKVGYCTMIDALVPAAGAIDKGINAVAEAAMEGADSTAAMKVAFAGRSNYLSEEQLYGTPDPGAKAVAIIIKAIAESLQFD